ncbi:MAG: pilus assembly protein [Planctomycetaceae bacterium]|nr:pilus assembly protein [Planctomycetaceae bacterium]
MVSQSVIAPRQRRGILLTMELLLILPLLLLVLSAIVQCSLLVSARSQMTSAALAAAHQISSVPMDADDIRELLRAMLGADLAEGAVADIVIPDAPGDVGHLHLQIRMEQILPRLPGRQLISGNSSWLVIQVPIVAIPPTP